MQARVCNYLSFALVYMYMLVYVIPFPSQSVTGAKFVDDVNSYWVVRGPHGEQCSRG